MKREVSSLFAENLRKLRRERKLSQGALAAELQARGCQLLLAMKQLAE